MLYKCNTFLLLFDHEYRKGEVMKVKTPKALKSVVILSLIAISIGYATKLITLNNTFPEITYQEMSNAELQEEVERLSQSGDVPFPIGVELIKRWTNNKETIASY